MPTIKGLGWTFDTVASTYEKFRPGYVDELYKMIFDYITLDESSDAVEVGIGSGQATLPILKTGCSLTAVEYGIEDAINDYGGSITIYDTIDLQLARKPYIPLYR